MAITVKTLHRPVGETSYLRATLKGMALTFSHLFRKKVTMQYPEEKATDDWALASRWPWAGRSTARICSSPCR
jgi:NADH-quinone oxidoreductase subunit I